MSRNESNGVARTVSAVQPSPSATFQIHCVAVRLFDWLAKSMRHILEARRCPRPESSMLGLARLLELLHGLERRQEQRRVLLRDHHEALETDLRVWRQLDLRRHADSRI